MRLMSVIALSLLFASCDSGPVPGAEQQHTEIPSGHDRFIAVDYIELDKIERISRFRSGIGHDYRDGAESCRSMKHYYQPKSSADWSKIRIISPVSGSVVRRDEEWAGTQIWIRPFSHPAYTLIIFHIALQRSLAVNDTVTAGEQLGTHIGSQTMSDIAVGYSGNNTWRLVSYFDVVEDSLFQRYQNRGVAARSDLIITKEARDADPLNCSGDAFGTSGTLKNWVDLL